MKLTSNLAGLASAIAKHLIEQQEEFMHFLPGVNSYILDERDIKRVVAEALKNF